MENVPCTYRISVKALIQDEAGRVLLLEEQDGRWELPGGGLEHGEDPRAALPREIAEETGFTTEWISDQPVAFWTIQKEVGAASLKWFAFVVYEAKVSGQFKPSADTNDSARQVKYFSCDEASALPLHDNTKPYFSER
ncbi:MAG TPA: NUDIX hydrolase [Candidatus Saccharimonadales bacterium]|nr:NUDIX hydrolase [Candidatus Saccharimonadales bacterium]